MASKVVPFTREKETKNTVRFAEVPEEGAPPVVGSIYLQKWFAGSSENIEVTIELK